jgi:hypothetical protein
MSQQAAVSAETNSSHHIRITLKHWMLWLTVTAILLALHRDMLPGANQNSISEPLSRLWFVAGIARLITYPFQALAVSSLAFLWSRFRNTDSFPAEPGHWLLLCVGIYTFSDEITQFAVNRITELPATGNVPVALYERISFIYELKAAFVYLLVLTTAATAAVKICKAREWAAVFAAIGVAAGLFAGANIRLAVFASFSPVESRLEAIALLLFIAAALIATGAALADVLRQKRRDFLHWVGLITAAASMFPTLVLETSRLWAF